ncbi:acetyltransferase [Paenibacillus sp. SYP-B3998]|uniref:Acetyltransferase n=1 Tax=Paenibacillus sp. SYP-B3998 TaxID=2678564 RepID=A0A6G3ZRQ1_9BACL|nr:acetyltransferase [Paenibacillus sp. SYP-B3998]NEW04730.1 acetyltransferase [Paenibacillus sp. SYP-B3998]
MKKLILIGGGGHGKVVLDVMTAQGVYVLAGVGDDRFSHTFLQHGVPHGPITDMIKLLEYDEFSLLIAIGSNRSRHAVEQRIGVAKAKYATLIHPKAVIGSGVTVGEGSVIMPGAIINCGAHIGRHCIINTGSIIEHENVIGDFVHLSPTAALGGDVAIEDGAHIGMGAKVIEGRRIGSWSTLGAGAVAITDIPQLCTAVGVPAKPIKYAEDKQILIRQRRA